jgi:GNAT superfamily N-acetyltransferase
MIGLTVLQDATPDQLVQAVALNHQELFRLIAICAGGEGEGEGEVCEADGVMWTYGGPEGEATIAFPVLAPDRAGAQLDEIVHYYLRHIPNGLVGCWSLGPPRPSDLGVRLLARGFQPGWRPCWMALDLAKVRTDHRKPEALRVEADNVTPLQGVPDLPYAGSFSILARQYPDRARHFVASLDGRVVGHGGVFLTRGPYGAAGIYDVGVVPDARNRGIGKAVTLAACLYAKDRGYRYAVLNATDLGRRIYEQLGFEHTGDGWTWWLNVPRLAAHPPTQAQVALAEATGRGDVDTLDQLYAHSRLVSNDLNVPLANEMTLMQLAVHCRQPAAAEWLVAHGAALDVLSAWDLGWKDRCAQMLSDDPNLVNLPYGEWKVTLLHEAASRGDVELARLALSANPDLSKQDPVYHSTPLGWAKHFQREEIARLIEVHQDG